MQPYQHDEILAMMSHLPHILAFALMNHIFQPVLKKDLR